MSDTDRPWAAPNLSRDERAEEFATHMWLNRMSNVFDLADPAKRYAEIKDECLEAIEAACNQALADASPKWVPVSDGLPEIGKKLWLFLPYQPVITGRFSGSEKSAYHGLFWDRDGTYQAGIVTHWQYVTVPAAPLEPGEEAQGAHD